MLEEELIDLMTFCLQNPDSSEIDEKHTRIKEIGQEIFYDGGEDQHLPLRQGEWYWDIINDRRFESFFTNE